MMLLKNLTAVGPSSFFYWLGFDPLHKLVDGYQQMCHTATRPLQRANHVQPPDGKRPGDRDRLERCSRRVLLRCESLTAIAEPD